MEEGLQSSPPTDAELQAWLDRHPEPFRREPRVAFRQVYLNPNRRGDARTLLARLASLGPEADVAALGDSLMLLPDQVELTPQGEVARLFGAAFADRLLQVEPGRWAGPLESGYGRLGRYTVVVEQAKAR